MKINYKLISTLFLLSLLLGSCLSKEDTPKNHSQPLFFRIVVPSAGYYYIPFRDLMSFGLSTPELKKLNLLYQGKTYPYWILEAKKEEDSKIYFYGPSPQKESNIKESIFFLAFEGQDTINRLYPIKAKKVVDQNFSLSDGTVIIHQEENNLYLPDSKGNDRWYGSLISTENEAQFRFPLQDIEYSALKIRAQLWSPGSAPADPDHAIRLIVNQSFIHDIYWDGNAEYITDILVPLSENISDISLIISTNELAKQIPQKIYLDWVELEYQQPLNFSDETFQFKTEQDLVIQSNQMDGFLLMSTKDKLPVIYQMSDESIVTIPNQKATNFSWIPETEFKAVKTIQLIEQPRVDLAPVDYLVIAPQALHQTLTPLMELRNQQGYETALLSTQQIYDDVNSGTPSPFAIQSFLQQLHVESSAPPKYLLLVGDYTYEILDYESSLEMLPSFFMDTSLAGETVSDFPYADLDGDFSPDLAIGRIPTSDTKELALWVAKLLNYEKQTSKNLQQIISVSDSSSQTFQESAISFLEPFKDFSEIPQVYVAGNESFLDLYQPAFSAPNSLLTYFGHGSLDRWGQQPILSSQQLLEMKTPFNPAFIFSFSCLNGYFIHPQTTSLTDTLLFHPNSGTVAVLASTSLTLHESQIEFSNQIISELQLGGKMNIGDLVTSAMREIDSENQLNRDVINTFILFGDPATSFLSIQTPQGN